MADIVVKNNANTTVTLKDVSELVLPTADGGTARFLRYNGVQEIATKATVAYLSYITSTTVPGRSEITSKATAVCLNATAATTVPTCGAINTTVSVAVTS